MEKYLDYQPEDFAQDEFFVRWVTSTDIEAETFWQSGLETFPLMRERIEIARKIVLLADKLPTPAISEEELATLKSSLFTKINAERKNTVHRSFARNYYWAIAASVAGLIFLTTWWHFQAEPVGLPVTQRLKASAEGVVQVLTGEEKRLITLPDGSSVLLKKNSEIVYPVIFEKTNREVQLIGEAFFEVAKDSLRPFLVKTEGYTTTVLGTSFNVEAYPNATQLSVSVKTGKVSVAKTPSASLDASTESVVLLPNQVGSFSREQTIQKSKPFESVATTAELGEEVDDMLFEYDETLVSDVFAQIEKAYNVKITYDKEVIGQCPVTASLTGEPFHQKLKLITLAVQADFQFRNNEILVTGLGCSNN
jgi:transmembrane sensor